MADKKPGYFESEIDDYPGSFTLPHPFLERHMRAWWEKAITPLKGLNTLDYAFYDGEWQAAVELINQFGKWNVDGVAVGDLDTDGVPMVVKSWVMQEVSDYVYPFLPPKLRLKVYGIT